MAEIPDGYSSPSLDDELNAPWRVRRLETMGQWGAALEQGDEDEVERIVRRSRTARVADADFGRLGQMVGSAYSTEPIGGLR